ncbi:hypothetical protein HY469_03145 [Candidatus Roizmanbacteria bacterium]|nr:hypothetical protein [Candidatus Roizmanbacteria bacterium]
MKVGDTFTVHNPKTLQMLLASQETQAYVMAFLSFFALAFFTIFAIRPTLASFFNLQRQIAEAKDVNARLETKIEQLLAAQQVYQDYQTELTLLDKALPHDPEFAQLIQKLEQIVNDKEATTTAFETIDEVTLLDNQKLLNLNNALPGVTTESEPGVELSTEVAQVLQELPTESVNFSLTIGADYPENKAVANHLLDLKRMIGLTALEFKLTEDQEDVPFLVETTLEAEAFYLPEDSNDQ